MKGRVGRLEDKGVNYYSFLEKYDCNVKFFQ